MSQIRLYLDEDASRQALVEALRNSGVDAIATLEVNRTGNSDEEQLKWSTEKDRVIYTFNIKDFCVLHKVYMEQGMAHKGIIVGERQSYSIGEQLRGLLKLMKIKSAEDMRNELVFLGSYIRME